MEIHLVNQEFLGSPPSSKGHREWDLNMHIIACFGLTEKMTFWKGSPGEVSSTFHVSSRQELWVRFQIRSHFSDLLCLCASELGNLIHGGFWTTKKTADVLRQFVAPHWVHLEVFLHWSWFWGETDYPPLIRLGFPILRKMLDLFRRVPYPIGRGRSSWNLRRIHLNLDWQWKTGTRPFGIA